MSFYKLLFVSIIVTLFSTSECKTKDITQRLYDRFNCNKMICVDKQNEKKPAYHCSGLLIRGVHDIPSSKMPYAWSLKARNEGKQSFSVAFLRKDAPFKQFPYGYDTGLIIYPHFATPKRKNTYRVYCAFPLNGHTDGRDGRHGCGKTDTDQDGSSVHCDQQGISSINKWKSHYRRIMSNPNANLEHEQCAFDMTVNSAAKDFAVMLQANTFLRKSGNRLHSYKNNELLFHRWNHKNCKDLPIEAFFFLLDAPDVKRAYAKAKMYQKDYYKLAHEKIPIVGIRLPSPQRPKITIKSYEKSRGRKVPNMPNNPNKPNGNGNGGNSIQISKKCVNGVCVEKKCVNGRCTKKTTNSR